MRRKQFFVKSAVFLLCYALYADKTTFANIFYFLKKRFLIYPCKHKSSVKKISFTVLSCLKKKPSCPAKTKNGQRPHPSSRLSLFFYYESTAKGRVRIHAFPYAKIKGQKLPHAISVLLFSLFIVRYNQRCSCCRTSFGAGVLRPPSERQHLPLRRSQRLCPQPRPSDSTRELLSSPSKSRPPSL